MEIAKASSSGRYTLNTTSQHQHTGTDSPRVNFSDLLNKQFFAYSVLEGNQPSFGGSTIIEFTGALSAGATSGTLTGIWTGPTSTGYIVTFSNGDQRQVTLTNGATSAAWSGGLSSAASADVYMQGNYGPFFCAPYPVNVQEMQVTFTTASGPDSRLFIEILKPGHASGDGYGIVGFDTGDFALNNQVLTSKLRPGAKAIILDTNDRLSLFMDGDPSGLTQLAVTVLMQINN